MFGKPQWFRPKTIGFGLVPVSWQGWTYSAFWALAIAVPFLLLIGRHQAVEAMVWMGLAVSALAYDVRHILLAIRGPRGGGSGAAVAAAKTEDNVLYILDSRPGQPVATRNYQFQVRR